jgi:site-specific DNA-cytosine methylase
MHNNSTIVPYISLCSGYEGIGLGLSKCIPNLRTIAYCEREAFVIANLVAKIEKGYLDEAPIFTDVTTFPWGDFAPFMAGGILSFGWPCQPVSSAGKRKATEDERWLFDIIADGISILRPAMLFAENVEGLLSAKMPDGSSVFGHCIQRLESLHYKVEAGIFSASEVGCVHQRKRVFILAYNQNLGIQGCWPDWIKEPQSYVGERLSMCQSDGGEQAMVDSSSSTNSKKGLSEERRISEINRETICTRESGGTTTNVPNTTSFGSGESGILQQGSNGELIECNGEQRGIELANSEDIGCAGRDSNNGINGQRISFIEAGIKPMVRGEVEGCSRNPAQPARPGQQQYWWEPPRVIPNSNFRGLEGTSKVGWETNNAIGETREGNINEIEPSLGGSTYGPSSWMVYAELCHSVDNRTDELRLLGNGVIPACAEKAFRVLSKKLFND